MHTWQLEEQTNLATRVFNDTLAHTHTHTHIHTHIHLAIGTVNTSLTHNGIDTPTRIQNTNAHSYTHAKAHAHAHEHAKGHAQAHAHADNPHSTPPFFNTQSSSHPHLAVGSAYISMTPSVLMQLSTTTQAPPL